MQSNSILYYLFTIILFAAPLDFSAQTSDTGDIFYDWKMRTIGETNHYRSSPFNGYVVLKDGTQIDGELKVMTCPARDLIEFKLETANATLKLDSDQVERYGLYVTRERAMGSKSFKEPGRNLHQGSLRFLDGSIKSGWIAFVKARPRHYNDGILYQYNDVIFMEELDGYAEFYASTELEEVTQEINENLVTYNYLEVSHIDMDRLVKLRPFHAGRILMNDGTWVNGKISRFWGNDLYVRSIFFKEEGVDKVKSIQAPIIQRFEINHESQQLSYVLNQGVFVELIQESDLFYLTRNPFSTSENMFLGFMSSFAATAAQGAMSTHIAKEVASSFDADSDEFNEALKSASREELIEMEQALSYAIDIMKEENMVDEESAKKIYAQRQALRIAAAGRPTELAESSISYTRKEWSLINVQTNVELHFVKIGMKQSLEPYFYTCGKYLLLSKKQQRNLFNWSNIDNVISLLEECQ